MEALCFRDLLTDTLILWAWQMQWDSAIFLKTSWDLMVWKPSSQDIIDTNPSNPEESFTRMADRNTVLITIFEGGATPTEQFRIRSVRKIRFFWFTHPPYGRDKQQRPSASGNWRTYRGYFWPWHFTDVTDAWRVRRFLTDMEEKPFSDSSLNKFPLVHQEELWIWSWRKPRRFMLAMVLQLFQVEWWESCSSF